MWTWILWIMKSECCSGFHIELSMSQVSVAACHFGCIYLLSFVYYIILLYVGVRRNAQHNSAFDALSSLESKSWNLLVKTHAYYVLALATVCASETCEHRGSTPTFFFFVYLLGHNYSTITSFYITI